MMNHKQRNLCLENLWPVLNGNKKLEDLDLHYISIAKAEEK